MRPDLRSFGLIAGVFLLCGHAYSQVATSPAAPATVQVAPAPTPAPTPTPTPVAPSAPGVSLQMPGVPFSPTISVPIPGLPQVPVTVQQAPIASPVQAQQPGVSVPIPGVPGAPMLSLPIPGLPSGPTISAPIPGVPGAPTLSIPLPGIPQAPVQPSAKPVQAPPVQQAAPQAVPQPRPSIAELSFVIDANVNPDASGRPSPVVVRVYELRSIAAFNKADFFSLYERDKEQLGPELISRDELPLMPGGKPQAITTLRSDTRYVGVIAAFRDIERARWRASTPIFVNQTTRMEIKLDRNEIAITLQ